MLFHHPFVNKYTVNYIELKVVNLLRDLGVTFDTEMNFVEHIDYITSKSLRTVHRSYRNLQSVRIFKTLYRSLARPLWHTLLPHDLYHVKYVSTLKKCSIIFTDWSAWSNLSIYIFHKLRNIFEFLPLLRWRGQNIKFLHNFYNDFVDSAALFDEVAFHILR